MRLKTAVFYAFIGIWLILLSALPAYFSGKEEIGPHTELFLENHATLPVMLDDAGNADFIFSVVNMESRDRTYTYYIAYGDENASFINRTGIIFVKDGAKASVPVSVKNEFEKDTKIEAGLMETGQEVHFWLRKNLTYVDEDDDEYRPPYDPDIPWERQDPLVQWYYRVG